MPTAPSYPGVYINELPSSVHTITGVPTSIAAFIGPAKQGPINVATQVNSWADFERGYGGLLPGTEMSYGVYQFFLNGGATAQIVRAANGATPASITLAGTIPDPAAKDPAPFLALAASSAGSWANNLQVTITEPPTLGAPNQAPSASKAEDDTTTLPTYNLTITDASTGNTENYFRVSTLDNDPNNLANQLLSSALVTIFPGSTATLKVSASTPATTAGSDGTAPEPMDLVTAAQAALPNVDIFNMLCVPDAAVNPWKPGDATAFTYETVLEDLESICADRRAILLVDPPEGWPAANSATVTLENQLLLSGEKYTNSAIYYPRVSIVDPATGAVRQVGPSGTMAGVYAATDAARGVWKAPAGTAATLVGAVDLETKLNDADNGTFNPLGVNCLRNFPIYGPVSWGARTTAGSDQVGSQWKYVPVRRLALFIEESLYRGTKWVVFEPNDEPLWSSIRLNVGSFMNGLYRQGAFQGSTPQQAYLVKCDADTNPQSSIDQGVVNIVVGFAPLKPAEFVFINIEQLAGDLAG